MGDQEKVVVDTKEEAPNTDPSPSLETVKMIPDGYRVGDPHPKAE